MNSEQEISKTYSASEHEDAIYTLWEASGAFNPDNLPKSKGSFSIAMPPPNATGTLHIGHAMMLVLQDLMIRHHRMMGEKTLWVPGTDHAGIATANKVEKVLAKEGVTRQQLGRDEFLKRVDEYVMQSRSTIRSQIRKMGSSCDWSRERYTLDKGLSVAVTELFVRMYEDGLIYRDYRIVNWCPRCTSTLADDEVVYREETAPFYFIKYGPVVIGTVRPETKFLDKTVVVHPTDERYEDLVGKDLTVEWIDGPISAHVIADEVAQKDFGTGAMTITPGHSFEDFTLAQKYHLPVYKIIDEQGNLTEYAGSFAGRNARESRNDIVQRLQEKGLIDHVDLNYTHNLSLCYRCGTALEPLPSLQWFVNVNKIIPKYKASLKDLMMDSVQSGDVKIVPKKFEKTYFNWITNLRDWCISRQIWFGHRLPVAYCLKENNGCGQTIVSREIPKNCPHCKNEHLTQDEDTLDTWFSSGLWTFSTLGWPDAAEEKHGKLHKKGDLEQFHPTSVLETGYDILFFWVARMILMSRYALGEVPFKTIYLHGLVLDANRKKMSKSHEETLIDPLDVIPEYGTDALRLSMLVGVTPGNDLLLNKEKIASYRNFINKLWNIGRFILSTPIVKEDVKAKPTLADRWIISRLEHAIEQVTHHLGQFRFSQAAEELRVFTWDELADWYLEIAKIEKQKSHILHDILEKTLALWHPFTPFVTEVLYQQIRESSHDKKKPPTLMVYLWPQADEKKRSTDVESQFTLLQDIIQTIRNARAENHIPPHQKIQVIFFRDTDIELLKSHERVLKTLARLDFVAFPEGGEKPQNALFMKVRDVEIYLPLGIMNSGEEKARLEKEVGRYEHMIVSTHEKLGNTDFVQRAPKHIVEKEHAKLADYQEHIMKLKEQIAKLHS